MKCENCGLEDGHSNACYAAVLSIRLVKLERVAEAARAFVDKADAYGVNSWRANSPSWCDLRAALGALDE